MKQKLFGLEQEQCAVAMPRKTFSFPAGWVWRPPSLQPRTASKLLVQEAHRWPLDPWEGWLGSYLLFHLLPQTALTLSPGATWVTDIGEGTLSLCSGSFPTPCAIPTVLSLLFSQNIDYSPETRTRRRSRDPDRPLPSLWSWTFQLGMLDEAVKLDVQARNLADLLSILCNRPPPSEGNWDLVDDHSHQEKWAGRIFTSPKLSLLVAFRVCMWQIKWGW